MEVLHILSKNNEEPRAKMVYLESNPYMRKSVGSAKIIQTKPFPIEIPSKVKNLKTQGKRNRAAGQRFEQKVRADLESEGWIVVRWTNNVEFEDFPDDDGIPFACGKLIQAKSNRFNMRTTGFPDFITYHHVQDHIIHKIGGDKEIKRLYENVGVECKSNGYLDKEEKEKCKWLLENNIFSKILISKKGKKRGEIVYEEFE